MNHSDVNINWTNQLVKMPCYMVSCKIIINAWWYTRDQKVVKMSIILKRH